MFSLENRSLRDVIHLYKHLVGGREEEGARLCSVLHSDRTRDTERKLENIRFHLNTKSHVFTMRVAEHWNRLAREVVKSPFMETDKT